MTDILIATYTREDAYRGYSKINHYHIPTQIRCYICDNSAERAMGILVNGEPCPDYYDIVEYNYEGKATYRHHFTDRESANKCFMAIMKKNRRFQKSITHKAEGGGLIPPENENAYKGEIGNGAYSKRKKNSKSGIWRIA